MTTCTFSPVCTFTDASVSAASRAQRVAGTERAARASEIVFKEFPDKLHPKKKLASKAAKQLRTTAAAKKAKAVPEKKETAPTDADGKARAKAVSTAVESPIPGQKPAPPDGEEDKEVEPQAKQAPTKDPEIPIPGGDELAPPDDEDEDDEPRAKQAPTKNAEIPIPGVKLAPPDDEDEDDEPRAKQAPEKRGDSNSRSEISAAGRRRRR